MNIGVVTTDARMMQIMKRLSDVYQVVNLHEVKDFHDAGQLDVLVLPVKGITANGTFESPAKQLEIPESFWKQLSLQCRIFCGLPQIFLETLKQPKEYYMQAETVLEKNAVLTAEGILFLLIDNTAKGIQQLHVDIIGYGRCGRELYKWLKALHVPARIIRRKQDGLSNTLCVEEWIQQQPAEVVINTSIQPIMTREVLERWKENTLILDIATPKVVDDEAAAALGIRYIKAGNLPALIAYETAGDLIADYIRERIEYEK